MDKNCDNCINSGRPSYEWPCTACTTAYGSAPSKWESIVAKDTNVPSWIPVSERLPDKDGTYMCFNRGAYGKWVQAVRFTKDARKFDEYAFKNQWKNQWPMYDSEYGYYAVGSITHWMPLPEPPKEE